MTYFLKVEDGANTYSGAMREDFLAAGLTERQVDECYRKGITLEQAMYAGCSSYDTVQDAYNREKIAHSIFKILGVFFTCLEGVLKLAFVVLTIPSAAVFAFFGGYNLASFIENLAKKHG